MRVIAEIKRLENERKIEAAKALGEKTLVETRRNFMTKEERAAQKRKQFEK